MARGPRTERALQSKTVTWLRAQGGEWEVRAPGRFTPRGVPDIIGCFLGRHVAIELKHPITGSAHDLEPEQDYWLRRTFEAGGIALATNDFEAVVSLIRALRDARREARFWLSTLPPLYQKVFL